MRQPIYLSPMIEVDLENTPDKFEVIPTGIYTARIDDVEEGVSAKDKPKVVVIMSVVGGEDGEDSTHEQYGRKLFDHIGISGKPISFKQLIRSAGLPISNSIDLNDLIGKLVKVNVRVETYTDNTSGETKETSRVKAYLFEE